MEYQCGEHLVTVDDDCGAIYFYVGGKRAGRRVAFTRSVDEEAVNGTVNADFDAGASLIGVEIIGESIRYLAH